MVMVHTVCLQHVVFVRTVPVGINMPINMPVLVISTAIKGVFCI